MELSNPQGAITNLSLQI
jgi:hypothetical protein